MCFCSCIGRIWDTGEEISFPIFFCPVLRPKIFVHFGLIFFEDHDKALWLPGQPFCSCLCSRTHPLAPSLGKRRGALVPLFLREGFRVSSDCEIVLPIITYYVQFSNSSPNPFSPPLAGSSTYQEKGNMSPSLSKRGLPRQRRGI